ncbi:MAG: hypothetical protein V1495_00870 [Pseudomonadota bacterium]
MKERRGGFANMKNQVLWISILLAGPMVQTGTAATFSPPDDEEEIQSLLPEVLSGRLTLLLDPGKSDVVIGEKNKWGLGVEDHIYAHHVEIYFEFDRRDFLAGKKDFWKFQVIGRQGYPVAKHTMELLRVAAEEKKVGVVKFQDAIGGVFKIESAEHPFPFPMPKEQALNEKYLWNGEPIGWEKMYEKIHGLIEQAVSRVDFTNLETFSDMVTMLHFVQSLPFYVKDPAPKKDPLGRISYSFDLAHDAVNRMMVQKLGNFVRGQKEKTRHLADSVLDNQLNRQEEAYEEAYQELLKYLDSPEWVVASSPYFRLLERRFGIQLNDGWFASERVAILKEVADICPPRESKTPDGERDQALLDKHFK